MKLFIVKKFTVVALRLIMKLVIYVASIQDLVLEAKNIFVMIPAKYLVYTNVFPLVFVVVLPKHSGIDNHLIDLVDSSHPITFQVTCYCSNIVYLQDGR